MAKLHIITPVKNSIDTALDTIKQVLLSGEQDFSYTVYNDYSDVETQQALEKESEEKEFNLIHLHDLTDHPSPNYLLVLQHAQQQAIAANCPLLIIESDVSITETTVSQLLTLNDTLHNPGLIAAVTTGFDGEINFPYLYARKLKRITQPTMKRLSFCCTLLNQEFLRTYDFSLLNPEKNWYDVFITRQSIANGFRNYLANDIAVLHRPHSSRPWKMEKYTNPIQYYWKKFWQKRDKI
jgi:hypothetical protein